MSVIVCVCVSISVSQRDGMVRFQKEEQEKTFKAITLFCFPEGINWAPLTEYHRCCPNTHTGSKYSMLPLLWETSMLLLSLSLYQ